MFRKAVQNVPPVLRHHNAISRSLTTWTKEISSSKIVTHIPGVRKCPQPSLLPEAAKNAAAVDCCRLYSSGPPEDHGKEPKLQIQGRILRVPNPFNALRTQWYIFLIQRLVDPHFSLQEFLEGAKQAAEYFTHLLCCGLYEEMTNITNSETIADMKKLVSELSPERKDAMEITTDDIQLADPYICGFLDVEDSQQLDLDVFIVAFKSQAHEPFLLEISLKFSQVYSKDSASGWTISNVNHFNIKGIDVPGK